MAMDPGAAMVANTPAGGGQVGMPGAGQPGADGAGGGPMGSPMTTPPKHEGDKAQAMAQVQMAMDLLGQAITGLGVATEEGEAVLSALRALSRKVGIKAQEKAALVPAQIEMMKNASSGGPDVAQMLAMHRGAGQQPGAGGPFM